MTYRAPIRDIRFVLEDVTGIEGLKADGAFPDFTADLIGDLLDAAGAWAGEALEPLNRVGDHHGAVLANDCVTTAPGFREAYAQMVEGGWLGLGFPEAIGGQGLPKAAALAVGEMIHAANMSFGLCPMLTLGAIEAIDRHGTDAQRALYLPKLVSGEWSGAMNLTEPQAGTDVGALTTRAEPVADGSFGEGAFRLFGSKIFITYGDHDMAANVVHLVLARTPGAVSGSKGVSLFLVPKFLPDSTGNPGRRNDLRCVGLEKKLGIHGSPTCSMAFGDGAFANPPGAIGWLIGAEQRGLAAMFTMMNSARLNVGLQGVAVAEAAFQKAFSYAQERRQGRADGAATAPSAIIDHADIRRLLLVMKAKVNAGRAICYATALAADMAVVLGDETDRREAREREELLTPIAKAWCSDMAVDIASQGVQIHGGTGFVEEGGAAQYYRDARITPIYEGTNGIQAIDLVERKLPMGGGAPMARLIAEMRQGVEDCRAASTPAIRDMAEALALGVDALEEASLFLLGCLRDNRRDALAGASAFLTLAGDVTGGFYLAKGALAAQRRLKAQEAGEAYWKSRIQLAAVYARAVLPYAIAHKQAVRLGADALFADEYSELAG